MSPTLKNLINRRSDTWVWDVIGGFVLMAVVGMLILTLVLVAQHGNEINQIHNLLKEVDQLSKKGNVRHDSTVNDLKAICQSISGCSLPK